MTLALVPKANHPEATLKSIRIFSGKRESACRLFIIQNTSIKLVFFFLYQTYPEMKKNTVSNSLRH